MIGQRDARPIREPRFPATRRLAATLATLLTFLVAPTPPAASAAVTSKTPGPCALIRGDDEGARPYMKRLIRCAANKWEVRGGAERAICIARHESGLNPKAVSADGLYRGLFQHNKNYWPGRYDEYTRPSWELSRKALNGRTAAIVSIRMAYFGGWAPWKGTGCW